MTSMGIYYLTRLLVTLLAIPCHEAGHALASWLMGDPTARNHGRLSLNPLRHFDLLGTICMVVAGVGWAKPVPTDVRRFKNPKAGMALTALAGPAANLLLAYLTMAVWKLLAWWSMGHALGAGAAAFLQHFLSTMVTMNVGLAVFNLIPVPPLDGSRVLLVFLPPRLYFGVMRYEKAILAALLAVVWFGALNGPLAWMNNWVWGLLYDGTAWVDGLASRLSAWTLLETGTRV